MSQKDDLKQNGPCSTLSFAAIHDFILMSKIANFKNSIPVLLFNIFCLFQISNCSSFCFINVLSVVHVASAHPIVIYFCFCQMLSQMWPCQCFDGFTQMIWN